jgi:hypothetical protein
VDQRLSMACVGEESEESNTVLVLPDSEPQHAYMLDDYGNRMEEVFRLYDSRALRDQLATVLHVSAW